MKRASLLYHYSLLIMLALIGTFLIFLVLLKGQHYLLFSFMCLACSILPTYWRFEHDQIGTQTLMFIAVLIALAVVSRVPLGEIPGVQVASFVIILSGISLGPELGFITGSATALVSNMFMGQGPWTPWQMAAWGLMGLTAGLLMKSKPAHNLIFMSLFALVWGYLFGWIMDLRYALAYVSPLTIKSFILAFGASFFPFDTFHAGTNFLLILVMYRPWERLFHRLVAKYDIVPGKINKEGRTNQ